MTENQFALNCRAIQKLPFVEQIHISANTATVYIELSPLLGQKVSPDLGYLTMAKLAMLVEAVIQAFEQHLVKLEQFEYYEVLGEARQLLEHARQMARGL